MSANALPTLKLTYFGFPGRGQSIRYALRLGKVPFEDNVVDFPTFGKLKAEGAFPLGTVPVLDVNGKRFCESNALTRYAGKLANLYPHCPLAGLRVDEILDITEEFLVALAPTFSLSPAERDVARARLIAKDGALYRIVDRLATRWTENGSGEFLVGKFLSVADCKIAGLGATIASGALDSIPKTYVADNWSGFGAYLTAIVARCEAAGK